MDNTIKIIPYKGNRQNILSIVNKLTIVYLC